MKALVKAAASFREHTFNRIFGAKVFVTALFGGGKSVPISQHFRLIAETEGLAGAIAIVVEKDRDDALF